MIDIPSILNRYRGGDFEQRLSLFLNYRDIRDEFEKIEEAERVRADRCASLFHPERSSSSADSSTYRD